MKNHRRQFLKTAGLSSAVAFLSPNALAMESEGNEDSGFVTNPDNHQTYYIAGRQAPVTIVVDKSRKGVKTISFCYEDIRPGDGVPVHKHLNEIEMIYIQGGSGVFTLGDKTFPVQDGSAAYVPKGVWHGLQNTGPSTIRMMFSYAPSGFEDYFREIGVPKGVEWKEKSDEEWAAISKKYGIVMKR